MSGCCVYFAVRGDESAQKVAAILEGLGYRTQRDLAETDTDVFAAAAAAASRRYRLTAREQQMLAVLLRGYDRQQIGEALEVSRPTIKWHLHNIYTKMGVPNSEAALRKALHLDDPRWLSAPLRHRDALVRIAAAAEQVVRAGRSGRRSRLDLALVRLAEELSIVRREAALELDDDDPKPLTSFGSVEATPEAPPT